jgi:hypothetical protein
VNDDQAKIDMRLREDRMEKCPVCGRPCKIYTQTKSGRVKYLKCAGSTQGPGCAMTFKMVNGKVII